MKYLLCLAFLVLAVSARSRHRRDARQDIQSMIGSFPKEEFNAFWTKLYELLQDNKDFFDKRLQENQGNVDMTLDQLKDKLGDKYPELKEKYAMAKQKMDALVEKLSTVTLKDVIMKIREFVSGKVGEVSPEVAKQRFQHFQNTVMAFFQRLAEYRP